MTMYETILKVVRVDNLNLGKTTDLQAGTGLQMNFDRLTDLYLTTEHLLLLEKVPFIK